MVTAIWMVFLIFTRHSVYGWPVKSGCNVRIIDPENGTIYFIENRHKIHSRKTINDFRVVYSWDCEGCVQASCELNGREFQGEENCGIGFSNTLVLDGVSSGMVVQGENVLALHLDRLGVDGVRTHMASAWSEFAVRVLQPAAHDLVPSEPTYLATRMGRLRADPASYLHSILSWIAPLQPRHAISDLLFEVPFLQLLFKLPVSEGASE